MSSTPNFLRAQWDLLAVVVLAAVLRLLFLDLKAPHFDEGVNGWFADQLRETGTFVYTPDNFHGPWHFYTVFVGQELLGRNIWALRLPAVAASVLTVPVFFMFGRWFGRNAARWAAAAFAVSPVAVFYGRYSIHEPWFALFTMLFVWGVIALWLDRDRFGLWSAVLGLTGMILNKETYLIHAGSLGLAAVVFAGWCRISPLQPQTLRADERGWSARDAWTSGFLALLLLVFFYSGNFFHPTGLAKPFEAWFAWTRTGTAGHGHEKEAFELIPFINYYWIALLARYEWPALVGLAWSGRYAWPSPAAPRLLSIYAAGVLVAYSIIPYKTPWCMASIVWPWFLFFGLLMVTIRAGWGKIPGTLLLLISLGQTIRLNFYEYESDAELYVYVQTYRSVDTLTGPLRQLADNDPRWAHTPGAIYLESYYPLPWMLGNFTHIGYYGGKVPTMLPEAEFHVIETAKADNLRRILGDNYEERRFKLRSGVDECSVFFSRDFLDAVERSPFRVAPRRGEP